MSRPFNHKYKIINFKKRIGTRAIDLCLSPVFGIARALGYQSKYRNQKIDLNSLKKILILRTAYIGDAIMTFPMLAPIKRACPNAEITMVLPVGAAKLLNHHPHIDKVIPYNAFWFYKQTKSKSLDTYNLNDLGLDSLDSVELLMELEEKFGTNPREEDAGKINEYINNKKQELAPDGSTKKTSNPKHSGKSEYQRVLQQIKNEHYDLVIDARGDIRDLFFLAYRSSARYRVSYGYGGGRYFLTHEVPYRELIHKVDAHLKILEEIGIPVQEQDRQLKIYLENSEVTQAKEKLKELGVVEGDIVIGIHPGGRKPLKSWAAEKYAQVAEKLMDDKRIKILVTGTGDEKPIIEKMVGSMVNKPMILVGKTDIRELGAIMQQCALYITNDSAPMHLSVSVGTPTLAIFGPSKSIETAPYGKLHKVVENDYPCRWTCDEDKCKYLEFQACMKSIETERVLQTARQMIKEI